MSNRGEGGGMGEKGVVQEKDLRCKDQDFRVGQRAVSLGKTAYLSNLN